MTRIPVDAATEQKYPVLLEYAKASFERIKQRLRHLWALARVKRVLNDYTLASVLDRQFGDLPVGLSKVLLSMIHDARTLAGSFAFTTCWSIVIRRGEILAVHKALSRLRDVAAKLEALLPAQRSSTATQA
jgi:hypothetical protein